MIMQLYMNWTTRTRSPAGSSDGYDDETDQSNSVLTPIGHNLGKIGHLQDGRFGFCDKTDVRATNDDSEEAHISQKKMLEIQSWAADVHYLQDANIA